MRNNQSIMTFKCEGLTSQVHTPNILGIKRGIRKLLPRDWSVIYLHLHEIIRIPNHLPIIDTTIVYCYGDKSLQATVRYVEIAHGNDIVIEQIIQEAKSHKEERG